MRTQIPLRALAALLGAMVLAFGLAACGDDSDDGDTAAGGGETTEAATGGTITASPENSDVSLTIGSKNFTEQIVQGEIYAQALEAAGYDVSTDLNLGSEQIAFSALRNGEIDAYPEYTSTALTSFFDVEAADVPTDPGAAAEEVQQHLGDLELTGFEPTPFTSANAVGLLAETAEEHGLETISDLEGVAQDMVLNGSPECRQRVDCLVGLNQGYGLEFAEFSPVDIGLRYQVLDNGTADLSIVFTTDAELSATDDYVILEDDQEVFPAGNVMMLARDQAVEEAGPDFRETVELVQEDLTEEVMQELNARVDVDRQSPAETAGEYLRESGYIE